jgi:transglutaminase-like putative cysteine protease
MSASIEMTVADSTDFVIDLSVARDVPATSEHLDIRLDGEPIVPRELDDLHGTRAHRFTTGQGILTIDYAATVVGRAPRAVVDPLDRAVYLRPSRYAESDALTDFARDVFGGKRGRELVLAVVDWVGVRLSYVPSSSMPTGGAQATLASSEGVCRDYAHLTIALLRALDVPARMVSVYAPGLSPMDFHAVVEVLIDEVWYVFDATHLAPRKSMVRIATGRDAADTAFITNTLSDIELVRLEVFAVTEDLPFDDWTEFVELG